jgi:hypothetical protein
MPKTTGLLIVILLLAILAGLFYVTHERGAIYAAVAVLLVAVLGFGRSLWKGGQ